MVYSSCWPCDQVYYGQGRVFPVCSRVPLASSFHEPCCCAVLTPDCFFLEWAAHTFSKKENDHTHILCRPCRGALKSSHISCSHGMGDSSLSGKVADQVKGGLRRAHPQKEPSDTALRPLEALGLSAVTECFSGVKLDTRPKCSPPHSALLRWQRTPKLTDSRQLIVLCHPLLLPSHPEPHS